MTPRWIQNLLEMFFVLFPGEDPHWTATGSPLDCSWSAQPAKQSLMQHFGVSSSFSCFGFVLSTSCCVLQRPAGCLHCRCMCSAALCLATCVTVLLRASAGIRPALVLLLSCSCTCWQRQVPGFGAVYFRSLCVVEPALWQAMDRTILPDDFPAKPLVQLCVEGSKDIPVSSFMGHPFCYPG